MSKAFCLVSAILSLAAACLAEGAGISVSETAQIQARPDLAAVSFGVVTEDPDAARSAQANATTTNAVINAITAFGIPRKDIETIQYSISPIIDYKPNPPVTTGYRVSNTVRVKIRDLSKIGSLIDVAVKAGANNVQGVDFSIENPEPLRFKALTKAISLARRKAQLMAADLGVKLGRVISASESVGVQPRPYIGPMYARAEAAPTPIIPGDVEISATASITYSIVQ